MIFGVADTTFAVYDMGKIAVRAIREISDAKVMRMTVPGIKDLPAAARILLNKGCNGVLVIGMPGPMPLDAKSAEAASLGIVTVQALTGKHVLECFVWENEADDPEELIAICEDRVFKHAQNLVRLLTDPEWFSQRAGTGVRQGHSDAGPLR